MFGYGGHIALIALNEEHYLPHRERAPLDVGLSACGGFAKVDEREFRPPETLLHQSGTRITGRPSMAIGHALKTASAVCRQAHADDDGSSFPHRVSLTT